MQLDFGIYEPTKRSHNKQRKPNTKTHRLNLSTIKAFDTINKAVFVQQAFQFGEGVNPFVGLSQYKLDHLAHLVQFLAFHAVEFKHDERAERITFCGSLVVRYDTHEPRILEPTTNSWVAFTFGCFVNAYLYLK